MTPTRAEVEDFLYHEAALLDAWKLDEWLGLLTHDARYRVPSNDAPDGDPASTLFLIADDIHRIRGRVARLKDPQALPTAEQALAADPTNVSAIDTAGWIAFNMGSLDRATQLLRDARLRNPDSAVIRYHLAAALVKAGRKVEAQDELNTALRSKTTFDGRADAETLLRSLK